MAALAANASERVNQEAVGAFEYMGMRVKEILDYKKANPGDGMVDALMQAQQTGEITEAELFQALVLFWGSGGHNPSYIISSGIEHFARHPDIYEIYRNQPEKRTAIINELFRLYPPELSFARYATEPLEIRGVQINVGERVRFIIDSANRDAEIFPNPDALDVNRPPQAAQNISFGMGAHQCAGQVISRAEVESVFNVLAERVSFFKLEGEPVMDSTDRSRAYVNLPIALQKIS
ncbi:Pentalenic acid synthase [compost metagenome]